MITQTDKEDQRVKNMLWSRAIDKLIGGTKNDTGKLPMHLIPVSAINALARVLKHGMKKYEPRNWEKGLAWSRPYAAAQRHLTAWWGGENFDSESGFNHLEHALCNIAFLIEYDAMHKELDDRPGKRVYMPCREPKLEMED